MSDETNQRGNADRSRVAPEHAHEARSGTEESDTSRKDLEEVLRSIGDSVDKVREYLRGRGGRGRK